MTNTEKYQRAFLKCLGVKKEELAGLKYMEAEVWDSVGHMNLVAALEDSFDIMMDTEDILDFSSYEKGMEILKEKYDVEF